MFRKFCFYDHLILFQSISVSEALSQLLSFTNSFNLLFNISHTLSRFRICICLLHHGRKSFHNISTLWIAVLFTSSMPSVGVFYYDEQVRRSHDVRKDGQVLGRCQTTTTLPVQYLSPQKPSSCCIYAARIYRL